MPHSRITSVPLDPRPDGSVFNASGVVEVGPGRFLFVDNHDPVALFEITLDASGPRADQSKSVHLLDRPPTTSPIPRVSPASTSTANCR